MIYPRGSHTPPPRCPECNGSGRDLMFTDESCTGCNGTGIQGNPGLGAIILFAAAALFWAGIYCWLS